MNSTPLLRSACESVHILGGTVAQWLALLQQEGPRSGRGPFCVEFVWSPCVCMCSLRVFKLPPTIQTGLGYVGTLNSPQV